MKIAYCLNSISEFGGISLATISKANALAHIEGNTVFVCVSDHTANNVSSLLSDKVKLIDLEIDYYSDDWKSRFNVIKGILIKRRKHFNKLKTVLSRINPDVVVSVGQSEKYFLPKIKGNWSKIRELHYSSDYRQLNAQGYLKKLFAKIVEIYDYRLKSRRYDRVVLLTHEDKERNWRNNEKAIVIPNPLTAESSLKSNLSNKKIIAVGRLEYQKNFSSLVRAFAYVVGKHPDWILEIYGKGSERGVIEAWIEKLNLQNNISIKDPEMPIAGKMAEASIMVLTSKFEGFGLVLVEGMACGLPMVSYDCPCGPKDIIADGEDGFLVTVDDEKGLAHKMCKLIEDAPLRKRMGEGALEKSKKFHIDIISGQWIQLFKSLIRK